MVASHRITVTELAPYGTRTFRLRLYRVEIRLARALVAGLAQDAAPADVTPLYQAVEGLHSYLVGTRR